MMIAMDLTHISVFYILLIYIIVCKSNDNLWSNGHQL